MTPSVRTSPQVVDDPEAARVLMDPGARRALEPFIGRERSAQEAAREAGLPLTTLAYRVRQYLRLGLLTETGRRARAGRAVRLYRAAEALFVPFSSTELLTATMMGEAAFVEMQRRLVRSIGEAWVRAAGDQREIGLHLFRDSAGRLLRNVEPLPDPERPGGFFLDLLGQGAPAVWDSSGVIRLRHEDAKRLQHELASVVRRYIPLEASTEQAYIVRLALAPLVPEEGDPDGSFAP